MLQFHFFSLKSLIFLISPITLISLIFLISPITLISLIFLISPIVPVLAEDSVTLESQFEVKDSFAIPCWTKTVHNPSPCTITPLIGEPYEGDCGTDETVSDCERPRAETHTLKGNLTLPETDLPYVRQMADWLEGQYYDEETLSSKIRSGTNLKELSGPLTRLLPQDLQDRIRRDLIRQIQAGEFTPDYDIKIKINDYFNDKNLQEISLKAINSPPPENSNQADLKNWQKNNFPVYCFKKDSPASQIENDDQKKDCLQNHGLLEDSFQKVPLAPRGDLTVRGSLAFINPPDCQKTQGSVSVCGINPGIGSEEFPARRNLTLEYPQLVRLREITKNLWQFLSSKTLQNQVQLEDKPEMGKRTDLKDDKITVLGSKPTLEVTALFDGPSKDDQKFEISANVTAKYQLPYLQDINNFTTGKTGFLRAAYQPENIKLQHFQDESIIGPGSFAFEKNPGDGILGQILQSLGSIFQTPFLEGVQEGIDFVKSALWP